MEVAASIPWLDHSHPNYERWKRGRELSIERGRFVEGMINQHTDANNLKILDLGSGEGGTSKVLSENNFVVSVDYSFLRLVRQKQNFQMLNFSTINANAFNLPFSHSSFDMIILQDVIEHLSDPDLLVSEIRRVLKPGGTVYLSTPNKKSFFNILSDPHWGLPLLSLFKRQTIKNYYLKRFRKSDVQRKDIAELLSLEKISKLFDGSFNLILQTNYAIKELLDGNRGIVWSSFHLFLIKKLKKCKLDRILMSIANDEIGWVNNYLTPTFFLVLTKR